MRKFTTFLLAATICVSICGCSNASVQREQTYEAIRNEDEDAGVVVTALQYTDDTDALETAPIVDKTNYMAIMCECCLTGDVERGRAAENERNKKIDANNLSESKISFDDLYELSKVITSEAGSNWLSMEWKMMVGEVVLNRVASVEFPNTILEVIHQRGQYSGASGLKYLTPYESCVEAASRLLNGERLINDPSVVFQSNHRQGSGTYLELYDSYLGYTYLCYSNHPEYYENKNM